MRPQKEIDTEIQTLRKLLENKVRWNAATRSMMESQVRALEEHWTEAKAERELYVDETTEDYQDGDNEEYTEVCRTIRWMNGDKDEEAPSEGA